LLWSGKQPGCEAHEAKQGRSMEFLQGLVGAGITVIALIVIIGLVAALFMIIFGIATGIDDQIQS